MLSLPEKKYTEINVDQKLLVDIIENGDNQNELVQSYVDYLNNADSNLNHISHPIYLKLKSLYEDSQRNCVNKIQDNFLYSLTRCAILAHDYKFAWHLVSQHETVLNFKSPYGISPLFVILLRAPTDKCNNYLTALMTIMLTLNTKFDIFIKILCPRDNYFNSALQHLGKIIDTKLFIAMIAFINPFQKTLHEKMTLSLRLRLAKYYLRNELGNYIVHLSDHQLEKILLQRSMHYAHHYYPVHLCSYLAFSFYNKKSNLSLEWKIRAKQFIFDEIKKNIWLFLVPENYYMLIKQLRCLDTRLITNVESLKSVIKSAFKSWNKYAEVDSIGLEMFQSDSMIDYFLGYAISNHLNFLPILTTKRIRNLTEDYTQLSKLITYLKSEDFVYKKFHTEFNPNIAWLFVKLFQYSKNMGNFFIEQVATLLKTSVITFTDFVSVVLLAFTHNEYMLIKLLLNNCDLAVNFLDEKMVLLNFIKSFLTKIQKDKIFFLLPHLSIFIKKIPTEQIRQILTTVRNPDDYLFRLIEEYKLLEKPYDFSPYATNIKLQDNVIIKLRNLLAIKQSYLKLKKYQLFNNSKNKTANSFTRIAAENYHYLMQRDRYTNHAIITNEEEFLCYKKLLSLPWKLGHRVENPLTLKKIIFDKEIRSLLYRATLGEIIQERRTPLDLKLDGFIFLTLGPCKSPAPYILRNSGYFEFDVDKLLQKFPDFFVHCHLSSHWFAFISNQEFPPVNYMGNIMHTVHDDRYQANYYYDNDNKYHHWLSQMAAGLYSGKRIIHILSLLFIKKLRLIGGSFYQYVLNNIDNTELLSNVFSQLMHPGYFEIRYPHAIPLDEYYCEIKTPAIKILNEKQLIEALDNIEFLKSCVLAGFDPEQQSAFYLKQGDKTNCYWGNFLARAIACNKTEAIDFLMEYGGTTFKQSVTSLTPFDAAVLTHNKPIIMKLLVKGIPLRGIPNSSYLPPLKSNPEFYLQQYSGEELYRLAQQGNLILLNEILQNCVAKISKKTEDKKQLFVIIKLLLERGADQNYKPNIYPRNRESTLTPIVEAIRSGDNEIAKLFIEHDKYGDVFSDCSEYCIFEALLLNKNYSLIEWIIEKNHPKNFKLLSKVHVLMLFIAKKEELFQLAVTKIFHDIGKNLLNKDYIQQWLEFMLQGHKNNTEKIFEFLKDHILPIINEPHLNWVDRLSLNQTLQILVNTTQFTTALQKIESYRVWKLIAESFDSMNTIEFVRDCILESKVIYKKVFFYKFIKELPIDYDITPLFIYLKNKPEFFVLAFIHYYGSINLDAELLEYLLEIFATHNFNNSISQALYDLLSEREMITKIIQATAANKVSIKLFSSWLIKIVNADEAIARRLVNMISELRALIWTRLLALLAIDPKLYTGNDIEHLTVFISSVCFLKPKKKMDSNISGWATRIGLEFTGETDFPSFDDTLFNSMKLTHPSSYPMAEQIFATASIITCIIKDVPHVYLGKKIYYGKKLPYLLAPGGYKKPQETTLYGAIREIREETKFEIPWSEDLGIASRAFVKAGDITFEPNVNYPNLPKISLLYRHSFINNFKPEALQRKYTVDFLWFDFKLDLSEKLSSGDDFADGMWVPIPEITLSKGSFFYKDQPILLSNALLIQLIQNKYVSPAYLDETLYKEAYQRYYSSQGNIPTKFFSSAKAIASKRELPEFVENSTTKLQKIA